MSACTEPQDDAALLHASDGASSKQLEISNAVVRIHKRYLGRGPRSARTHLSHELAVVVLMGALRAPSRASTKPASTIWS